MAYGIQVFNTSANTIQIDDNYRNFFYNRTIYYSDSASLASALNSLAMDEFPAYDLSTSGNFYPTQNGYLNIFKRYSTIPPAGYGLTVYKENGDIAYSSAGRPVVTIGNTEYIWNSFVFPSAQIKHLYLPDPRAGKTRNIIFSRMIGDIGVYNYNTFSKGYNYWLYDQGEFYIQYSSTGGMQHIQMTYSIPANFFLIVAILDA